MASEAKADDSRALAYRIRHLPLQLVRARRRVVHLEREAVRLGMTDLLEDRL